MQNNYCYFDGKITKVHKIKISPYDIGILRGYGVFDVMCTQSKKPFLIKEHWERLNNSAETLGLTIPVNFNDYEKTVKKLINLNKFEKSTIRTILTGGQSSNAFNYEGNETFYILVEKFKNYPSVLFKKGGSAFTLEYNRDLPASKITNYVMAIKNQKEKEKNKAVEIIYTKNNKALEASTSNFFIVKNNQLITSKEGILLGITRNLVIKLAIENGIKIIEKKITIKELFTADEIFLTATNKNVMPIVKINGKKIGTGRVGNYTKKIIEYFKEFSDNY